VRGEQGIFLRAKIEGLSVARYRCYTQDWLVSRLADISYPPDLPFLFAFSYTTHVCALRMCIYNFIVCAKLHAMLVIE